MELKWLKFRKGSKTTAHGQNGWRMVHMDKDSTPIDLDCYVVTSKSPEDALGNL